MKDGLESDSYLETHGLWHSTSFIAGYLILLSRRKIEKTYSLSIKEIQKYVATF
jgi:hypothetical protein